MRYVQTAFICIYIWWYLQSDFLIHWAILDCELHFKYTFAMSKENICGEFYAFFVLRFWKGENILFVLLFTTFRFGDYRCLYFVIDWYIHTAEVTDNLRWPLFFVRGHIYYKYRYNNKISALLPCEVTKTTKLTLCIVLRAGSRGLADYQAVTAVKENPIIRQLKLAFTR